MKYFFNCKHRRTPPKVELELQKGAMTYVFNDHDEEGKLDGEGLVLLDGAEDEVGGDVGTHDLEHRGLNISICQSLDVTISHVLVPDLKGLGTASNKHHR